MVFTRQHYELLAEMLKDIKPLEEEYEDRMEFLWQKAQWCYTVGEFARNFYADNERFNRGKFVSACGL